MIERLGLWKPKHHGLLTPRARLSGRVEKIQILEKGEIVREYEGFDNLVLDSGLNLVATNLFASLSRYCAVGTGNTAPAVGQSLLTAEAARTATMVSGAGNCGTTIPNPYTYVFKRTYDFALGSLSGNYSELGFSPNAGANSTLFSRVLIQVSGTPTSITVLNTQQLRVVYTLTVSFGPIVDTAFSINFGGGWGAVTGLCKIQNILDQIYTVNTSGLAVVVNGNNLEPFTPSFMQTFVSTSGSPLAAVGSNVARTSITEVFANAVAYVPGSFQKDFNVTYSVTQGNGAIQSFGIGSGSSSSQGNHGFCCVMGAPKTKLSTNTLTFGYRLTWSR